MTPAPLRLTPQQQAIVDHDHGPALVYAVAGAGKTTAMVHRIERLVREGLFAAHHILATSFNKDANRQIEQALARWPACAKVNVMTLHGLGYSVIQRARRLGYITLQGGAGDISNTERLLLRTALATSEQQGLPFARLIEEAGSEEFLTYVRTCKGNLAYPEPRRVALPRRARRMISAAPLAPYPTWYRDLFALFEEVRREQQLLTFEDMLQTGWELLMRHPDLLQAVQKRYRCVIVDEAQDVNLAQTRILDAITEPERNLMVIGDDDQTIYEWRGASSDYLLKFQRRYRGQTYFMTQNFRGRASHLALANQVIQFNQRRQQKQLGLTRGFGGLTRLDLHIDAAGMADAIAAQMQSAHAGGAAWSDMAVLVRVYRQTEEVERALRTARIPHVVVGAQERPADRASDQVMITTIFRAKGLEWPQVFIPNCNAGFFPLQRAQNIEEERRLFYVALTRTRDSLHLHALQGEELTPFLRQADFDNVMLVVDDIGAALKSEPAQWHAAQFVALAINARRLYLQDYFLNWWKPRAARRRAIAEGILQFYAALRRRRLFRKLQLKRDDERLWRAVAGARVNESPIQRPDLEPIFEQLKR